MKRPRTGWFSDDPLAEWAIVITIAIACFALVLLVPGPAPRS